MKDIIKFEYNKLGRNARVILRFLAEKGGKGTVRGIGLGRSSIEKGLNRLINDGYVKKEKRGVYSIIDPVLAKVLPSIA